MPRQGPLILAGNHTGAMEVVLMAIYSRQQVEFFAAAEMPWNGLIGVVMDLYGIIPVHRGETGTASLKMGIQILNKGGVLGIFPEGGVADPGKTLVKNGAAWLSYMAKAPILPIYFGDTRGKLAAIFRLKRPKLTMHVGNLLPPVTLDHALHKKDALQKAANEIMQAIWNLVPEEEQAGTLQRRQNERFSFEIQFYRVDGEPIPIPSELELFESSWISRFIHRPNLIDSIRDYIFLPVQVLKELHLRPSPREIWQAARSILDYVEKENPQYFIYRYGKTDGQAFHESFRSLEALMRWAMENEYILEARATYEYLNPVTKEICCLSAPEENPQW